MFIPAVKDASTEQLEGKKNALGILLERTVRSKVLFDSSINNLKARIEQNYRDLLSSASGQLDSLSESLSTRIREWAHPDATIKLRWHDEAEKYVSILEPLAHVRASEGQFSGDVTRFGHGFQRSFLFSLLQELSSCQVDPSTQLILACEEPELHQHPPQAKHLASVLEKLSAKNSQVLVCTHSPHFVSGRGFEDVRLVRKDRRTQKSVIGRVRLENLAEKISEALGDAPPPTSVLELKVEQTLQVGLNEMFFATVLVFVEGVEDEAHIKTYLTLLDKWQEFRACGCHIVPVGGKNKMIQPLAIAKLLEIPAFAVFDADTDECKDAASTNNQRRDNLAILRLAGLSTVDPLPSANFINECLCMWTTKMGDEIKAEIGAEQWSQLDSSVRQKRGIDSGSFAKNALFIGSILTEAWERGTKSKLLEALCEKILGFGSKLRIDSSA